jgi:hypothetical protein
MMDYVIYNKKKKGNPIVRVVEASSRSDLKVIMKASFPEASLNEYGVLEVDDKTLADMFPREYKLDKGGKLHTKWAVQEEKIHLISVADDALNTNAVIVGKHVEKLIEIRNLKNRVLKGKLINPELGIIDVGKNHGILKVSCLVRPGSPIHKPPQTTKNFTWKKDRNGKIVGVRIKKKSEAKPKAYRHPPRKQIRRGREVRSRGR